MNRTAFVICTRLRHGVLLVPGSIQRKCRRCGEAVMVAPSTFKITRETGDAVVLICDMCVTEEEYRLAAEGHPLTVEQVAELRQTLGPDV